MSTDSPTPKMAPPFSGGAGAKPPRSNRTSSWECANAITLGCKTHGEQRKVRCGRWRSCPGCARRKQWEIKQRFVAGIDPANVAPPFEAMFFTLTFDHDVSEAEAQAAWRKLVAKLRYRELLGPFGWVLQRTKRGRLHFHGIAHMPFMHDGLALWRGLIQDSGFGIQNKLVVANPAHAGYCARYISTGLATLEPLRRSYGFSQDFPRTAFEAEKTLYSIAADAAVSYDAPIASGPELLAREWELEELFGIRPDPESKDCLWGPRR